MEKAFHSGISCIVMDDQDNVATLLKDVKKGETLTYTQKGERQQIELKHDIDFGHKVAISPIQMGQEVLKYGEVIGAATSAIQVGEHVHIHNIEGIRGRGDKKVGEVQKHANV
ncbi:UxaA family hydrolase [Lederbergia sp. NSJ-179]|uniref:UxaA family hydrolase n=1 Tax=Lederbergia sp. NSJ-179 TaxID=2931402 RepID=UPI001FD5C7F6|nr:UxaA family hydrolase [Lederbergia sp. NSJ-179]MCJ7840748.1 UxaA family hydrolase [Lederbergia sp. NSJ-179]